MSRKPAMDVRAVSQVVLQAIGVLLVAESVPALFQGIVRSLLAADFSGPPIAWGLSQFVSRVSLPVVLRAGLGVLLFFAARRLSAWWHARWVESAQEGSE